MSEPDGQIMHCSDCGGRSYGWPRCATCEVRACSEPQPIATLGTLFEETS